MKVKVMTKRTKKSVNVSGTRHAQFDPHDLPTTEVEYKIKSELDDQQDDPTTDPEGVARRASREGRELFPIWVFDEYETSRTNYWGKPWADGQLHLIPRKSTVRDVVVTHEHGGDALTQLANRYAKTVVDPFVAATCEFLDNSSMSTKMNFMRGFSNTVEAALAERAYQKYLYERQLNRPDAQESYIEDLETRALEASQSAGDLYATHLKLWEHLGWSNEPQYNRIENAIALRLTNAAKWIDENKRIEVSKTVGVKVEDRKKLALLL